MMQDVHVKLNPGLPWQKQHSTRKRLFSQQFGLKFKEETSNILHLEYSFVWCWNFNTTESRSESFEMWCWRGVEIIWTNHMRNEVLQRVKEERNILQTIKWRKSNWIGHIFCRNCLLNHIIAGKMEEGWVWREDKEEDVSSYCMTLRKPEDTGKWKKKY